MIISLKNDLSYKHPANKLQQKIYVMENIYHYEITAILEEMCRQTVTNFRQGLNVPPFDPEGRSMKQLDMNPISFRSQHSREMCWVVG